MTSLPRDGLLGPWDEFADDKKRELSSLSPLKGLFRAFRRLL